MDGHVSVPMLVVGVLVVVVMTLARASGESARGPPRWVAILLRVVAIVVSTALALLAFAGTAAAVQTGLGAANQPAAWSTMTAVMVGLWLATGRSTAYEPSVSASLKAAVIGRATVHPPSRIGSVRESLNEEVSAGRRKSVTGDGKSGGDDMSTGVELGAGQVHVRGGGRTRLVVGAGRASDLSRRWSKTDVTLSADPTAEPDVLGDVARVELPEEQFDEIVLAGLDHGVFTWARIGVLAQLMVALRVGGTLIIEVGPEAGRPLREIPSILSQLGAGGGVLVGVGAALVPAWLQAVALVVLGVFRRRCDRLGDQGGGARVDRPRPTAAVRPERARRARCPAGCGRGQGPAALLSPKPRPGIAGSAATGFRQVGRARGPVGVVVGPRLGAGPATGSGCRARARQRPPRLGRSRQRPG
jgi:hypothetical protein